MNRLNKILVPVDFSESSRMALDWAMLLADKLRAKVILLHAMEISAAIAESAEPYFHLDDDVVKRVKMGAARRLQAFAQKYDEKKILVAPCITEGKPFLEIIKFAKSYNVDLIVMGTHGHMGDSHILIGSAAEKVVRKAPCPVLTVKHPDYKFEMP